MRPGWNDPRTNDPGDEFRRDDIGVAPLVPVLLELGTPWDVFDSQPDLVRALGATYHNCSVAGIAFEPDVIMECTGAGQVIAESML